jgi:hypothetical protein
MPSRPSNGKDGKHQVRVKIAMTPGLQALAECLTQAVSAGNTLADVKVIPCGVRSGPVIVPTEETEVFGGVPLFLVAWAERSGLVQQVAGGTVPGT